MNVINNMVLRNTRQTVMYQCVIVDLALAGAIDKHIAEGLIGRKFSENWTLPKHFNDFIKEEDYTENPEDVHVQPTVAPDAQPTVAPDVQPTPTVAPDEINLGDDATVTYDNETTVDDIVDDTETDTEDLASKLSNL